MSLAREGWVWILPVLAGAMGLGFWIRKGRLREVERYLNGHPGPEFWPPPPPVDLSRSFGGLRASVLALSGLLLTLSALGLRLGTREVPVPVAGEPLIILLDVSRSMVVPDAPGNRLLAARLMVRRVLGRTPGVPVALGIFAGDAQMVLPPTTDRPLVLGTLDAVGPSPFSGWGTLTASALEMVLEGMHGGTDGDEPGVLILSDGEDFGSPDQVLALAREIRLKGGWVSTLTLGTEAGGVVPTPGGAGHRQQELMWDTGNAEAGEDAFSRANPGYLAQIAQAGGGFAARAGSVEDVKELLSFLDGWSSKQALGVSMEERPVNVWPLLLSLAIAGLFLETVLDQTGQLSQGRKGRIDR